MKLVLVGGPLDGQFRDAPDGPHLKVPVLRPLLDWPGTELFWTVYVVRSIHLPGGVEIRFMQHQGITLPQAIQMLLDHYALSAEAPCNAS